MGESTINWQFSIVRGWVRLQMLMDRRDVRITLLVNSNQHMKGRLGRGRRRLRRHQKQVRSQRRQLQGLGLVGQLPPSSWSQKRRPSSTGKRRCWRCWTSWRQILSGNNSELASLQDLSASQPTSEKTQPRGRWTDTIATQLAGRQQRRRRLRSKRMMSWSWRPKDQENGRLPSRTPGRWWKRRRWMPFLAWASEEGDDDDDESDTVS